MSHDTVNRLPPARNLTTPAAPVPTRERALPVDESHSAVDRLWSVRDVSVFLGIPVATLHQWRYLGTGPDAYRVGKHLRYSPDAVLTWLETRCRREASR